MLYIINLQNSADTNAVATRLGVPATAKIYENVHMIVVEDPTDQELTTWRADADVKNIVEDQLVEMEDVSEIETIEADTIPTTEETFTTNAVGDVTQSTLLFNNGGTDYHSWHLDRITKKNPSYMNREYSYLQDGLNIDLYILDSGVAGAKLVSNGGLSQNNKTPTPDPIGLEHSEFIDGSFAGNYRVVDGGVPGINVGGFQNEDTQGHGTYCAQYAAGLLVGLAKKATIWSCKVMDSGGTGANSGYLSDIINGANAVIAHHTAKTTGFPSVASISIGTPLTTVSTNVYINEPGADATTIMDDMEMNMVTAGIHVARSAGNGVKDGTDNFVGPMQSSFVAGARSSALVANKRDYWNEHDLHDKFSGGATTVTGTTPNATNWPTGYADEMAYFSNYGWGNTLSAPGHNLIAYNWIAGGGYVYGLAGTSFSTPMIAGMLCLRAQAYGPGETPASARTWILANAASTGYITDLHTEIALDANPLQCLAGEPYILVKVPAAVYNDAKNIAFQLRGAAAIDTYSVTDLNNKGHVKSESVDQVFSITSGITSVPPDGTVIKGTTSNNTATVVRAASDGAPASIVVWCKSSGGPLQAGEEIINIGTLASYGTCTMPSTGTWLECNMDNMNATATVVNAGGSSIKIGTLHNTHEATDAFISAGTYSWLNSIILNAHFDDPANSPTNSASDPIDDYFPIDEQPNLLLFQPYVEETYQVKNAAGSFMTATGSTEALGNFAFGAAVNKDMSFNHTTWAGEPLGAVTSTYSIINGSLPSGLSFDTATAIISGTLTVETAALYTFTIMNSGIATSQAYSMNCAEGADVIVTFDVNDYTTPGVITASNIITTGAWTEVLSQSGMSITYTASKGENIIVETSLGQVGITLPASPAIGDTVRIIDGSGHAGNGVLNEILISSTGNIMGSASDLYIGTGRAGITLIYYNTANGWILQEN